MFYYAHYDNEMRDHKDSVAGKQFSKQNRGIQLAMMGLSGELFLEGWQYIWENFIENDIKMF